ncbi:MAG: LPS export ABC transporter periplasmic protein LptC [Candidatus Wenzhouxiangella sp. M2_3B_020]
MSRRRQWLAGLVALAALVAGNWWLGRSIEPEPPAVQPVDERIDYALDEFSAEFFDADGASTLRVAGPRLTHDAVSREIGILAPTFEIGASDQPWRGRAETGRVIRDADRLILRGDVVLQRSHRRGPVTVESRLLAYDRDAATVTSPGPARMRQNGTELAGGTLTVWVDEERMEFRQDAHAIYRNPIAAGDG